MPLFSRLFGSHSHRHQSNFPPCLSVDTIALPLLKTRPEMTGAVSAATAARSNTPSFPAMTVSVVVVSQAYMFLVPCLSLRFIFVPSLAVHISKPMRKMLDLSLSLHSLTNSRIHLLYSIASYQSFWSPRRISIAAVDPVCAA